MYRATREALEISAAVVLSGACKWHTYETWHARMSSWVGWAMLGGWLGWVRSAPASGPLILLMSGRSLAVLAYRVIIRVTLKCTCVVGVHGTLAGSWMSAQVGTSYINYAVQVQSLKTSIRALMYRVLNGPIVTQHVTI